MQYHISLTDDGGYLVQSISGGRPVTRIGVRTKLSAAQRLAESTAGRRLTWVRELGGSYVSQ